MASEASKRWTWELIGAAYDRTTRHGGDSLAAGIAFGTMLSLTPLFLIVLAGLSLVVGEGDARSEALALVRDVMGYRGATLVGTWIDDARDWSTTATALGLGLFVFGSARLVGIVETAFKVIFEVPVIPTQSFLRSIRAYAATQLRGLLVTLVAVLLLIVSLLIRIVVPIAFAWANSGLLVVMSSVLSFSLLFTSLALIFRVLPPRRLLRSEIVEGALISSSILEVSFVLLRVVTLHVDFGAAYGAAGALIGTLIVLYFAAQLFVFGAEITAELEQRRTALALAVSRLRT